MTEGYTIQAHRTGGSICGAASAPLKSNGSVVVFETVEAAEAECKQLNQKCNSANVYYTVNR
jgi:ATP-dependent Clp protease adapter protein ClpS